jgi:hypothetical protein
MCQICDVAPANGNGIVNQADIDAIANAIANGPIAATGPDDRRDANGDGMITQGDRGTCQQLCTNANCQ